MSLSRLGRYFSIVNKRTNLTQYRVKAFIHATSALDVAGQEIKMPSLSPTMSEGTIVKWLKKEGDAVQPGDVLCDIQTDKAVISMETDEEGILAKILVQEDVKDVKVGTLIALMVGEGEDWKQVEIPSGGGAPAAQSSTPASGADDPPVVQSGPPVTVIKMPSLSPTMSEGTIVKWLKNEGDVIQPGDALCDIQTDKAVMSMETEEEGILAKILLPDDSKDVQIGTMIALIVAEGEDWKAAVPPVERGASSAPAPPASAPSPAPTKSESHAPGNFGPAVRALLEVYQLSANEISATGPGGKILKSDVLQFIKSRGLQKKPPKAVGPPVTSTTSSSAPIVKSAPRAAPGTKYIDLELSNVRKVIAKRLTESKQNIPHAYGSIQCNIDNLLKMRKDLQNDGIKVSVNDVVIAACAAALQACPEVNALFKTKSEPVPDVDISVAVATENGLITPIVKSAHSRTLSDISATVRELAGKARDGKLQPHEFQGGSFTISNLGMFGITEFSAIINPPQVAILAVGGPITRLDSDLQARTDIRATLSFDARAITDAEAARFLQVLREMLEKPTRILSGASAAATAPVERQADAL